MAVQLRHLMLVEAVVEAGTLTAASQRLFLTQSALSHQLGDLERRVGGAVFRRVGRRMVPTPMGLRILDSARSVLGELRQLEAELQQHARGVTGLLRVTTQCYTCYHWLAEVLPRFRENHPAVAVRVVPEESYSVVDALLTGRIDLAIAHRLPDDERLRREPLFVDELVTLVPPGHRFDGRRHLEPEDFADQELIGHSANRGDSYFFQTVLFPAGITPVRLTEVKLTEATVALIRAGAGIAVLSRWSVAPQIAAGELVPVRITRNGLFRQWEAVTLRMDVVPVHMRDFTKLIANGPGWLFEREGRAEDRRFAGLDG
jgi:LysR family transcriptional regulator, regulator for metE and metH